MSLKKRSRKAKQKTLQQRYPKYQIGRGTYGDPKILTWGEDATLRIGDFCSIADGVQIALGGEHRTDWVTTFPFNVLWDEAKHIEGHPKTKGDVIIGNDVWIATEAIIMSGVTIGDGAVIGARALVAKDVPPYTIVGGNPAKIIKQRFPDDIVERLLALQWWNWEDQRIAEQLPLLLNHDIEAFLDAAEQSKT